jgi:hypothetical protein
MPPSTPLARACPERPSTLRLRSTTLRTNGSAGLRANGLRRVGQVKSARAEPFDFAQDRLRREAPKSKHEQLRSPGRH